MNERKLRTLLNRIVFLAAPLPLGVFGAACGGATSLDDTGEGGSPEIGGGGSGATAGTRAIGGTGATGGAVTFGGTRATGGTRAIGGTGGTGVGKSCMPTVPSHNRCSSTTTTVPSSCLVGELTLEKCKVFCGSATWSLCSVVQRMEDQTVINCPPACVEGRRPAGFTESIPEHGGLGAHFVRAAELEAVSILAFRQLRGELRAHGARRGLLSALSRAARDERRHTRTTRALARRFGGEPSNPSALPERQVSLETIATENVVEGCVRETYGAAVATWQAREARDPVVRAAMRRIAREETRHAALSNELHRWLERRLDRAARQRVEAARRRAIEELRAAIETPYERAVAETAGLPSVPRARALFSALERDLWT